MLGLYSSSQIIKLLGISRRQILYWVEKKIIQAPLNAKGANKFFSFTNIVELKVIKSLLEQGISLQAVRKTLGFLRTQYPEYKNHLSTIKLITNGKDIFIIDNKGRNIKAPHGQLVLLIPYGDYYKDAKHLIKKHKIKPELESLKFASEEDFWSSNQVGSYINKLYKKQKQEKTYSLNDLKSSLYRKKKA